MRLLYTFDKFNMEVYIEIHIHNHDIVIIRKFKGNFFNYDLVGKNVAFLLTVTRTIEV